jgi:hypothetical protein
MQRASQRAHRRGARFPVWLDATVTISILLVLTSLYVLSLHLGLDWAGDVSGEDSKDRADAIYFGLHGIWLVVAAALGGTLGVWFRRTLFGFGALFLTWMLVVMVSAQVASFELACRGHNDIIRHWEC